MKKYLLENPQVVITLIIGFFTLIIAWRYNRSNLKISKEKLEKELFKEFNERYDILNDSLAKLSSEDTLEYLKDINSLIANKKMYNVIIDYFNLCAEQYYWKQKDRISDKIWVAWNKGMMEYYKFPIIQQIWEDETLQDNYKSYYLNSADELFKFYKKPNWIERKWKKLLKLTRSL